MAPMSYVGCTQMLRTMSDHWLPQHISTRNLRSYLETLHFSAISRTIKLSAFSVHRARHQSSHGRTFLPSPVVEHYLKHGCPTAILMVSFVHSLTTTLPPNTTAPRIGSWGEFWKVVGMWWWWSVLCAWLMAKSFLARTLDCIVL